MPNPQVTIDQTFNWGPPNSGVAAKYRVAVDDPGGTQLNPPGTVEVLAPTTSISLDTFLTGQPVGNNYAIYVAAVDANDNQGPFLVVNFDYVSVSAPTGGTFS